MKLIYLYGPMATGKLTVAQELEKRTGYPILHNHLFNDMVEKIMSYDDEGFFDLAAEIKTVLLSGAVKNGVEGVIMTACYAFPNDNDVYEKRINGFKDLGIDAKYVHLIADREELKKRVAEESRQKFGKLKDADKLCNILDEMDFFTKIPFVESLQIDNTNLAPEEVADRIMKYIED